MRKQLVRMLSTGRNGTKFMASVFADQGYQAFHEELYVGEPFVAIKHYLNWLGDLWIQDRDAYYALKSRFAQPYRRAVEEALEASRSAAQGAGVLSRLIKGGPSSGLVPGVVVHSAHLLTPATPLVQEELADHDIDVRNLVLLRNPLRTIHAIYTIEGQASEGQHAYRLRPEGFYTREDYLAAAQIWANTYRLIHDLIQHYSRQHFRVVWLEQFSADAQAAQAAFDFLDLDFDPDRFIAFTKRVLDKPLRASKTASVRNSDLYIQPDFSFDHEQLQAIGEELADVIEFFDIDWEHSVAEYVQFHTKEKERLGFSRAK